MSDWESDGEPTRPVPYTTIVNSTLQETSRNRGGFQDDGPSKSFQREEVREERQFQPSRGGASFSRGRMTQSGPTRDSYRQSSEVGSRSVSNPGELRGLARGRSRALEEEQMSPKSDLGIASNNETSGDANNEDREQIQIPTDMLGRIIGKKGAKIQELERNSGCSIKAPKQSEQVTGPFQTINIIGLKKEIQLAIEMINEVVISSQSGNRPYTADSNGSAYHRQGFGSKTVDDNGWGGRDRGNQWGASGRGSRGTDSSELRKPRGFGDREDSRQRSGFSSFNSSSSEFQQRKSDSPPPAPSAPRIDWTKINSQRESDRALKFDGLRSVKKNFYNEDPVVAAFTESEVSRIRKENFGLIAYDLTNRNREVPNPIMTFEQAFRDYPDILEKIYAQKFVEPTPIQKQGWPIALSGHDMVGIAQTGTGKTLAFLLPGLIHMSGQTRAIREDEDGPGILVVCPTRELALQTDAEVKKFKFRGSNSVCVYGGGDRSLQISQLHKGAKVVIGTPGRLHDLQMSGDLILKGVSYFVLDEADRMLDMGFEPQILKLVIDIRPDRQTLMTSATWPPDVRRLADTYLKEPFQVYVGSLDLKACHSVSQTIEILDGNEKKNRTYEFLSGMGPNDKVLIFTSKKATADDVASDFFIKSIDAQSIHGDRAQEDREQALDDFKTGRVRILIATDVASRGLDIPDVTYVVNFDFPNHIEDYVHRIGRTGRAGKTGKSLTFFTRENWRWAQPLIDILEEAQQDVPDELVAMAERFKVRQERDRRDGRDGRFGGGGGRGRGGRYSKRDNDKFGGFI